MGDIEIRELAAGIDDLTDVAKQVLRDEIKKRGTVGTIRVCVFGVRAPKNREWEYDRRFKDQIGRRARRRHPCRVHMEDTLWECNTTRKPGSS